MLGHDISNIIKQNIDDDDESSSVMIDELKNRIRQNSFRNSRLASSSLSSPPQSTSSVDSIDGIPTSWSSSSSSSSSSAQQQQTLLLIPERVYVVYFPTQRGAHSVEFPKGSGNNIMLGFVSLEGCQQFCNSLRKQNFFDPTVRR
jgi:hypothetical protein